MTSSDSIPSGDLATQVLQALSTQSPLLSAEAFPAIAFQDIKAALDRLGSRSMITYETIEREEVLLEPEAEQIATYGSHEARVFEALRQAVEGMTVQELEAKIGDKNVTKLGQGKAFREKWISKSKEGKLVATVCRAHLVFELVANQLRQAESIEDTTQAQLQKIREARTGDAKVITDLKKRKLIKMQKVISFKVPLMIL